MKEGSDLLSGSALDKLSSLAQEKKANRRQFQDESHRIGQELKRLQEQVAKLGENQGGMIVDGHTWVRGRA